MKKLLIYIVPVALLAAQASGAPSPGRGEPASHYLRFGVDAGNEAPLVLAQGRGGGAGNIGGGGVNRGNVNPGNANRGNFNSRNFQRDVSSGNFSANRNVSVNRNVNVNRTVSVNRNVSAHGGYYGGGYHGGGYYGPNWGGVAAGVAIGAGVVALGAAAASSTYYPPAPPYSYSGY